jgi:hypothetical protein
LAVVEIIVTKIKVGITYLSNWFGAFSPHQNRVPTVKSPTHGSCYGKIFYILKDFFNV